MSQEAYGVVALVPMRAVSERVPGKNTRLLAGRPLYHHVIEMLLTVPEVEAVFIDTDSDVIADEAPRLSPRVRCIERPSALRGATTSMNRVLLHDVSLVEADVYLQTHSTNPFLRATTVSGALRALRSSPAHDSLFSVTPRHVRLWSEDGEPINHDPAELLRTQDLRPVYEENSNLYIFSKDVLLQQGNRIGARPLLFAMDPLEAWDIDGPRDFEIAEAVAKTLDARESE